MSENDKGGVMSRRDAAALENSQLREALKLAALRAERVAEDAERIVSHIRELLDSVETTLVDES